MESVDLDVAESSDGAEPPHLDVQPRAEPGKGASAGLAAQCDLQSSICFSLIPLSGKFSIFTRVVSH